jgi:23S rRNA (cytidine1920-2'-O)/16S rRNA (cytidine1409-2'-O)-methyltransferase
MSDSKQRLDQALVERGFASTRTRAQAAIKAGHVRIAGRISLKPADLVGSGDELSLAEAEMPYVSRAAFKLKHALEHFKIDPEGLICLDIGASTGGFTQILLQHDAYRVYAVDVGHGQLAPEIASAAHVISLEKLNIKDISSVHVPEPVDLIVCDVSFISLAKALPAALSLCPAGALLIALIKPQFEVGRAHIRRGGIVRDETQQQRVRDDVAAWLNTQDGWTVLGITESPITGSDGNREFLIAARKNGA